MADRSQRLAQLVGDIYQAGADAGRWHDVLARVCDALGACGALLGYYQPQRNHGQTEACVRLDPQYLTLFHTQHLDNIWTRAVVRAGLSRRVVVMDQFVPFRELKRSALYADILRPQRIVSSITSNFLGSRKPTAGIGGLSLMYANAHAVALNGMLDRAGLLAGHIQRAVELSEQLQTASDRGHVLNDAIDRLRIGVFTIDSDGSMRCANGAAGRVVAACDGLTLRDNRLQALGPGADHLLAKLIVGTTAPSSGTPSAAQQHVSVRRPSGLKPFAVEVVPFRGNDIWPRLRGPVGLCFVSDPEVDRAHISAALATRFDLTAREAQVACAIANGETLSQIARDCAIARTTVRTHLQHAFDKTGVRSQAALTRLVMEI